MNQYTHERGIYLNDSNVALDLPSIQAGKHLDYLILTNVPSSGMVKVGQATMMLEIFDKPEDESPERLRDLLAQLRETNRRAESALIQKLERVQAWAPSEQDLEDVKDLQRSEPRAERYMRTNEEQA